MRIRNLLFSLFSLVFFATSHATEPQMYVGIQGGYADTNFNKSTMRVSDANGGGAITSASIKNHVFAARAYAGYQFNDYVAAEMGYLRPRSTRFTQVNGGTVPDGDISEYAIDVRGKVFLPMAAYIHLSPYLELGAAYMNARSHGGITRNGAEDFGYSLHPVLGAGIGYNFTPHITGDISWATMTKRNSEVPRIDMYFVGLTYRFSIAETQTGAPNYGDINNDDP